MDCLVVCSPHSSLNKLREINDVVRMCRRSGVPLDLDNAQWAAPDGGIVNALKGGDVNGLFEVRILSLSLRALQKC